MASQIWPFKWMLYVCFFDTQDTQTSNCTSPDVIRRSMWPFKSVEAIQKYFSVWLFFVILKCSQNGANRVKVIKSYSPLCCLLCTCKVVPAFDSQFCIRNPIACPFKIKAGQQYFYILLFIIDGRFGGKTPRWLNLFVQMKTIRMQLLLLIFMVLFVSKRNENNLKEKNHFSRSILKI